MKLSSGAVRSAVEDLTTERAVNAFDDNELLRLLNDNDSVRSATTTLAG